MKSLNVLNIEDSVDDHDLILRHLKKAGYEVYARRVETPQAMKAALAHHDWDVIISDYRMPHFSGIEAYEVLRQSNLDIPFIIVSATIGEDTAVKAMLAGVNDYMMKSNLSRLAPAIEREVQESMNRRAKRDTEEALRESENRLQLAVSSANMGVWDWNMQTDTITWSDICAEIIGVPSSNSSFKDIEPLIAPEHLERVHTEIKKSVEENIPYQTECIIVRPGGRRIWVESHGKIDYDRHGKPLRMVGTIVDITEQKNSEHELRRSEERFRSLIDAISQIVWTADADGNLISARSRQAEVINLANIDVMQRWFSNLHPDDRERAIANWRRGIEEKKQYKDEYRLLDPTDGTYHIYISRGTPVFEKDGRIREWVGSLTDITKSRLAENAIRASEEKFRALIKATSQIVWTIDPDGQSDEIPQWWLEITGQSPGEADHFDWIRFLHPDDRDRTMNVWKNAFETTSLFDAEYRVLTKKNEYRHFAVRGVPVFDSDGKFRQWIGTFSDVTEKVKNEEALRKSEEELRQSQKLESVGRLAGGIAHDFNNMLTAINGYSDLTLRQLRDDDPVRANLEEIRKAGERSAELTHQLLAFSRQQILQEKVLDLNNVIRDTSAMLERVIGEDIQLIATLAPDIGQIKTDPGQLSQVILNLVVNSRDAMPHGGKITIETKNIDLDETYASVHTSAVAGPYVMLAVSDTGVGIDEQTLAHIFEPFFTTKGLGIGTGLGLSTVYGIVKQSGGNIWVYSEPGEGTTFKIYFPLIRENISPVEKPSEIAGLQGGTETILLVEDEEILRRLGREILESSGYVVIEAVNGVDALEIMRTPGRKVDLLLTDVVMPEIGGRELAANLAEKYPEMRVLFTSGYTDDAIVRHGIIDQGTNFIQKPFTLEALTQKVRESLDAEI